MIVREAEPVAVQLRVAASHSLVMSCDGGCVMVEGTGGTGRKAERVNQHTHGMKSVHTLTKYSQLDGGRR